MKIGFSELARYSRKDVWEYFYPNAPFQKGGRKEQIAHFCACAERSFKHGAMWSLASAYQIYMDARDELPRPNQPILSIWGASDRSHPANNAHSLARLYGGVQTVTFDDLGHTPELEAPDLVLAAIRDFVGER